MVHKDAVLIFWKIPKAIVSKRYETRHKAIMAVWPIKLATELLRRQIQNFKNRPSIANQFISTFNLHLLGTSISPGATSRYPLTEPIWSRLHFLLLFCFFIFYLWCFYTKKCLNKVIYYKHSYIRKKIIFFSYFWGQLKIMMPKATACLLVLAAAEVFAFLKV